MPDGIEEVLPPDAQALELKRRQVLKLYNSWGYDLVMPAMIEYTDSLLTGTANSLDRKTFTFVDALTGKQMGVRSDMTPQVARIDAHQLASNGISRLCYCGHLIHALADGLNPSRSPLQIGAELFGNDTVDADIEVVSLMLETLHALSFNEASVDLGHVGIFRSLFESSGLDKSLENNLFDMLQRKSIPELTVFLSEQQIDENKRQQFLQLALLNGGIETIAEARSVFKDVGADCLAALDSIEAVVLGIQKRYPAVHVHCDLAELRGYEYHTGLVFAGFLPGQGREVARGGRYDDVGEVFGVARPATGFSTDLLALYQLSNVSEKSGDSVLSPNKDDAELCQLVKSLRNDGKRVIVDLSLGKLSPHQQSCNQVIELESGQWVVKNL